jgi:hypothetical protein
MKGETKKVDLLSEAKPPGQSRSATMHVDCATVRRKDTRNVRVKKSIVEVATLSR